MRTNFGLLVTQAASVVLSLILSAAAAATAQPTVIYVNAAASPGGNGASWATAYRDLQPALNQAASIAPPADVEIWMASGVYKPTQALFPGFPRSRTFFVPPLGVDVTIYGGQTPGLSVRTLGGAGSTLSGDFNGDDLPGFGNTSENAYTVLTLANNTFGARLTLDGVRISGGNANSQGNNVGGGIITQAPLTLRNSSVTGNRALSEAGGIYASGSILRIESSTISDNAVISGVGGGLSFFDGSKFRGFPSAVIVNSQIINNFASSGGGAIQFSFFSFATITNCTIASNRTNTAGAGVAWDSFGSSGGQIVIQNSILWNNTGDAGATEDNQISPAGGSPGSYPLVRSSCVQNIFFFADPTNSGADPRFRSTSQKDYRLAVNSPYIDRGDNDVFIDAASFGLEPLPEYDLLGNQRIIDGAHTGFSVVDLGAQENLFYEPVWFTGSPPGTSAFSSWQNPAAWYGGAVPSFINLASFSANAPSENRVSLSADTAVGYVTVSSGPTTIDLLGRTLTVSDNLAVDRSADLSVRSLASGPSVITTNSTTLSTLDDSLNTLTLGFGTRMSTNAMHVGVFGQADVSLGENTSLSVANNLRVGVLPGSGGHVSISGEKSPGSLSVTSPFAEVLVGDQGSGAISVSQYGSFNATGIQVFALGNASGSSGVLNISENASVNINAFDIIFGVQGDAAIGVGGAAILNTVSANPVLFASLPGSSATIDLAGAAILRGSTASWINTGPGVLLGGGGEATFTLRSGRSLVSSNGSLPSDVTIGPRSRLTGIGSILFPSGGSLINNGVVRPGVDPAGPTVLPDDIGSIYIGGAYSQARLPGQTAVDSGAFRVRLAAPYVNDSMSVLGEATLGGSLFADLVNGYDPAEGDSFNVFNAGAINGEFDVSYLPGFVDGRYWRLDYTSSSVSLTVARAPSVPTFSPPTTYSAPAEPVAGVLKDLSGDGLPDLAVVIPNLNPALPGWVGVYINLGVDTAGNWLGFAPVTLYQVGRNPRDLAAGELNGDGLLDLVIVNTDDNTGQILLNLGGGVMSPQPPFDSTVIRPTAAVTGKFTSATQPLDDIAIGGQNTPDPAGQGVFQFFQNTGVFRPGERAGLIRQQRNTTSSSPVGGGSGDVDNDKDIDVVSPTTTASLASALINTGPTTNFLLDESAVGQQPEQGALGTLRAPAPVGRPTDGTVPPSNRLDYVTANRVDGTISILLNMAPANPGEPVFDNAISIPVGPEARSVALADIDGDGDLDILVVVTDPNLGPVVRVLTNQFAQTGQLTFSLTANLFRSFSPNRVLSADLTGKNRSDLVTLNGDTSGVPGQQAVSVSIGSVRSTTIPGDTNNDGRVDMLDLSNVIVVFGVVKPGLPGDVNFDGKVDFADLAIVLANFGFGVPQIR